MGCVDEMDAARFVEVGEGSCSCATAELEVELMKTSMLGIAWMRRMARSATSDLH